MDDVDCGGCPDGQSCGGGGMPNVCGMGATCAPKTCADLAAECGLAGDGCGGMLDCGTCSVGDTCGGNGIPGVCGHNILDSDPTHQPFSLGAFAHTEPDANSLCQVVSLSPAQQDLSSGPRMSPVFPTESAKYVWSNV